MHIAIHPSLGLDCKVHFSTAESSEIIIFGHSL